MNKANLHISGGQNINLILITSNKNYFHSQEYKKFSTLIFSPQLLIKMCLFYWNASTLIAKYEPWFQNCLVFIP